MIADLDYIKAKLLLAAIINILESVDKSTLIENLKDKIEIKQIEAILDELINDNMLVKEKEKYRLTPNGYKATLVCSLRTFTSECQ
jgi:predicted transcriptional regulator